MGLRFRRSFKILPGIRMNVSKSGVSTSIGKPGATVNLRPDGRIRETVGLPGTGLSYSQSRRGWSGAFVVLLLILFLLFLCL
jgi:hypothetical protein